MCQSIALLIIVMVQAQASRNTVLLSKIRFEEQRSIPRLLRYIIYTMPIRSISVMIRARKDERQVRSFFFIQYESILGEAIEACCLHVNAITFSFDIMCSMVGLSALTLLRQSTDSSLKDVTIAHPSPTVHHVALTHFGLI